MTTESQMNEIHGHTVLNMMEASGKMYSLSSLIEEMHARFGKEARYGLCSGGGMDAQTLVETLWQRGKFKGDIRAFTVHTAARCDH